MGFVDRITGLRRHRQEMDATMEEMEQTAAALALDDPDAYRDKMAEIDRMEREALRLEVAAEEAQRRQEQARAEERQKEQERHRADLKATLEARRQIAAELDQALSGAESCFQEFEELCARADHLRNKLGTAGRRTDAKVREGMLVRAMWHGCPTLARRVGLRFAPGGVAKFSPIAKAIGE
jgi:hypothetical protein